MCDALHATDSGEGVIFLTDISGAAPYRVASLMSHKHSQCEVISGIRYSLMEEMLPLRESMSSSAFRDHIVALGAPDVTSLWHQQQKNPPFCCCMICMSISHSYYGYELVQSSRYFVPVMMNDEILFLLLLCFSTAVSARYMQTTKDAAIWSQIGDNMVTVGNIRAGQILSVTPMAADYYKFNFGFGVGFIDKGHLAPVQGKQKVEDGLGDLNKPLSNQNLVTWKDTRVYNAPDAGSAPFGVLVDNLRYPIISKLKGRLNQTWYQIRIGDRLAYISALDAQPDNGIPVLTYHHILRDEENTRFRHTSTTTSVRAFSNQMTWLRDRGYTTLTLYQLEDYIHNRANFPARAVAITFDDGLKSVSRYAYPVLKQYGMKATAFIISSRIKRHPQKWNPKSLQFMSVSELRKMSDVFDFQSHTHFLHRVDGYRRPILYSRSYHNILFDFERSRRALAQFNPHVFIFPTPLAAIT